MPNAAPWSITLRVPTHDPVTPITALLYVAIAVAVTLAMMRRPAFGVAALIVLAPLDPARYVGPTSLTPFKAGLIGAVIGLLAERRSFAALGARPARVIVAAFAAVGGAIVISALHAAFLPAVAREALKWSEYALTFVVAVAAYAAEPDDRPIWLAFESITVVVCAAALSEYVLGAHSGIFIGGRGVPRIAGLLEGPNQLAGWLEIAISVLFARNLLHRDGVLVAVLVLAVITDVLTFSRAGIVAMVFGGAVVLLVTRAPRGVAIRFAGAAIAGTLGLALAGIRAGVPPKYFSLDQVPQQADHLGNRAELWNAALALWRSSPITGVGAGNYELDLARVGDVGIRTHANSLYLQSLAEGGIVLTLAMIALLGATIVTLAQSSVRRPIIVGMLAAACALVAHQVFDDLFFFPKVATLFWLGLGIAVAEIAAQSFFERRRADLARGTARMA